jgi:hypothetical protein
MKSFLLICAGVAVCFCGSSDLHGQTADVSAVVQFSNGSNTTVTDFSSPIAVQPSEVVNITLQFGSDAVGDIVVVQASGGGSVSLGNNVVVVGDSGSISFAFQAPADSGQKSVNIQSASKSFSLQFSVGGAGQG